MDTSIFPTFINPLPPPPPPPVPLPNVPVYFINDILGLLNCSLLTSVILILRSFCNVLVRCDLDVSGNADISGNLTVIGETDLSGNVDMSGNLNVVGDASFNSIYVTTNADITEPEVHPYSNLPYVPTFWFKPVSALKTEVFPVLGFPINATFSCLPIYFFDYN